MDRLTGQSRRAALVLVTSAALASAFALPGTALAQTSAQDRLVQQLQAQGFTEIEIRRTFLGRVRITAEGPPGEREIVLNPHNGTILRDYFEAPYEDEEEDEDAFRTDRRDLDDDDQDDDRSGPDPEDADEDTEEADDDTEEDEGDDGDEDTEDNADE